MSNGISEVEARIAEIKSRFEPASAQPSTTSGSDFATTLSQVLGADSGGSFSAASNTTTGRSSGQAAVDAAKQWLGVPYVWGGNDPDNGLDCSGLVQQAYKELGIQLPRVAADQARMGTPVASLAQAKPGDLVAFGSPVDHIGIYAGDNKMVVAPKRGDVVKVQDIYKTPVAIRRIVPDDSNSAFHSAFTANASGLQALSSNQFSGSASEISGGSNQLSGSASQLSGGSAIPSALRSQYDDLFQKAGAKYGIAPNLLAAVAKQESGFNASAGSGAGAQGLMQIMPGTAQSLGVNALDPAQAVDGAARMLSGLVGKFGSVELALAGYNAGPNAVAKHGGIPPYQETQNYVRNVMAMSRQGA